MVEDSLFFSSHPNEVKMSSIFENCFLLLLLCLLFGSLFPTVFVCIVMELISIYPVLFELPIEVYYCLVGVPLLLTLLCNRTFISRVLILLELFILFSTFLLISFIFIYFYLSAWAENQILTLKNGKDILSDSSVHCSGFDFKSRRCFYENLCLGGNYLFVHGESTHITGFLPSERNDPCLVELSSVVDHNQQYFFYEDISKEYALKFNRKALAFNHRVYVFNRFNPHNLMHVFHDDLLPLFFTLASDCHGIDEKCFDSHYVMWNDNHIMSKYDNLYKLLFNAHANDEFRSEGYIYCFKEAFVGVEKRSTWYQYGFHEPQGPILKENGITGTEIRVFTNYFNNKLNISVSARHDYVVLITRKINRRILNDVELCNVIEKITKSKVIVLRLEENSIESIVEHIGSASILISVHGSALILSMFLKPYSILIELFPYAINPKNYTPYKTLAELKYMNVLYFSWVNLHLNSTVTHPDWPKHLGGLKHLDVKERKSIMESSEVLPHLCCDNPAWLYRIYQDTIVELESFEKLLKTALDKQKKLVPQKSTGKMNILCGKIGKINCFILTEAGKRLFCLNWVAPSNLMLFNSNDIAYEIWIQVVGQTNVKAYFVYNNKFCTSDFERNQEIYVWIRCLANNVPGAFNSKAETCLK